MGMLEVTSGMMAFSTFMGVMFAGLYYLYQILEISYLGLLLFSVIYLNINLLFLLYMRRYLK